MRILTFSTLYPSAARPTHGIFVETRLRKVVETGVVSARVVAPCPWFPFSSAKYGDYAVYARTPPSEVRHGIRVDHPRYPLLPKIGMSSAPLALFAGVLPRLLKDLRNGKDFDLIDAHYFYPDGIAAVLLGRAVNRPVVITARGSDLNVISTYAVPQRWIQWAARRAAGLVTVSAGLKRRLIALGTAPERVLVLRNGVDLALFRPRDRELSRRALGFTRPTLLAIGNLIPLKRHSLIIEAVAQLDGVDLAIVGDGPERTRLEALAQRLGVPDRVRLLGRMPQEDLPDLCSAADLLVHPSLREGWPNVLLESMACGTPVVVTDFDGVADVVGAPEAGRIVPQATPQHLAGAIRNFLALPPHREETRRYAEAFDWRSTTAGQIRLFREICERRPPGAPIGSSFIRRAGAP